MRMILILILVSFSMVACKEMDAIKDAQLGNVGLPSLTNINAQIPNLGNTNAEPLLTNVNAPPVKASRIKATEPGYLPNGAYTAFNEHYCLNGDCSYVNVPNSCVTDILFPGDFEIYADDNATFWNSVPETVELDLESDGVLDTNNVLLLSQTTGHQGKYFSYKYLGKQKWEVSFSQSCSRIYKCHVGDCLN